MDVNTMEVQKVKLSKTDRLEITYKKTEADGGKSEVQEKHSSKIHQDFRDSVNKLAVHYALLTGYMDAGTVKSLETANGSKIVESCKPSGYSIGGDDEDQGIVITGHRILPNGKAVILNTPFYRFNESEESRYKFMDELIAVIEDVKSEALKYLGGKFASDPQGQLEFSVIPDKEEALQ